ncbi:MAG: RCC1 repeat-containing protein, partial [Acidimicrobiales bacterium]|nr:RCC1 repeat-containing protein [Acidimicrobiales bacterium]
MSGLDAGYQFTCGISDGAAYCWGLDTQGQLGNGPGTAFQTFVGAVEVAGTPLDGKTIAQVAVGYSFACALTTDDVVACWGDNSNRQLGDGTTTERQTP